MWIIQAVAQADNEMARKKKPQVGQAAPRQDGRKYQRETAKTPIPIAEHKGHFLDQAQLHNPMVGQREENIEQRLRPIDATELKHMRSSFSWQWFGAEPSAIHMSNHGVEASSRPQLAPSNEAGISTVLHNSPPSTPPRRPDVFDLFSSEDTPPQPGQHDKAEHWWYEQRCRPAALPAPFHTR